MYTCLFMPDMKIYESNDLTTLSISKDLHTNIAKCKVDFCGILIHRHTVRFEPAIFSNTIFTSTYTTTVSSSVQ